MTEVAVRCSICGKTLRHHRGYCPLFPEDDPPPAYGGQGAKWAGCLCLVHTCYTAPRPETALAPTEDR